VEFSKQDIANAFLTYTLYDPVYTMLMRIFFPPDYAFLLFSYRH